MSLREVEVFEESISSATLVATGKKRDGQSLATMYSPIFRWDTLPADVIVKNAVTGDSVNSADVMPNGEIASLRFEIPALFDSEIGTTYTIYFKCKRSQSGEFIEEQTATLRFVNNQGLWSVELSWN